MLNKIKNWIIIVLAGLVTAAVGFFTLGQKSKWAKEKERQVEKTEREAKIKKAEIKQKEKVIAKADKAVESAKEEAKKAVNDFAELRKLQDEKIAKAGDNINEDIPEEYEKKEFNDNTDVINYFNELLTDLHSSGKQ